MEDIDGDNGVEGYLYEPERADFLNIQNDLTDDDSSSDNEGECLGYSAIEEPKWIRALFTIENQQWVLLL